MRYVAMDVLFGKRITGSYHHVNTEYMNRIPLNADFKEENFIEAVQSEISKIQTSVNIDDNVREILSDAKVKIGEKDYFTASDYLAELSYLGYELNFIVRIDMTESIDMESINRVYALNNRITVPELPSGLRNLTLGIGSVYDEVNDLNLTKMVMAFLSDGRINFGDHKALTEFEALRTDYELMNEMKQEAQMDIQPVLHYLQKMGYSFIAYLNSMPEL